MTDTYVVIVTKADGLTQEAWGPYHSFRIAEGDAKALDGVDGANAITLPLRWLNHRPVKVTQAAVDRMLEAAADPHRNLRTSHTPWD